MYIKLVDIKMIVQKAICLHLKVVIKFHTNIAF